VEMGTAQQLTALQASTIDVGIFPIASAPALLREFRRMSLFEDEVCIALVHPGHPLAARRSVSIRELETTPLLFVARDENPWFYDDAFDAFAAVNFTPRIDAAFNGLDTIWSLVAQGQGWNLASREQWVSPPPGVVALQLTDFSLPFVVQLVHRHDETRPTVLAMVDAIQRSAEADTARAVSKLQRARYTEMAPNP
jgi:DNA-binding transcriptional LysR family regulator